VIRSGVDLNDLGLPVLLSGEIFLERQMYTGKTLFAQTVVGAIVLFSAWVFQQSVVETANRLSRRIDAAENVFITYQSNNALFNAILATTDHQPPTVGDVRRFQAYNYLLGLKRLADITGVPLIIDPQAPSPKVDEWHGEIERRKLEMRENINRRRELYNTIFVRVYGLGSLVILIVNVLSGWRPVAAT
jgi:hypothetical protein